MQQWVGLFRGVNVGGNNKLPMVGLCTLLQELGATNVRTYIQSGNVVFGWPNTLATNRNSSEANSADNRRIAANAERVAAAELNVLIADAISKAFGFTPKLLLISPADFRAALANNPFVGAATTPKLLHLFFLETEPAGADLQALDTLASATERWAIVGRVFYLHTPDGFGTSKLAGAAEKKLGVAATARNFSSVQAIAAMLDR